MGARAREPLLGRGRVDGRDADLTGNGATGLRARPRGAARD